MAMGKREALDGTLSATLGRTIDFLRFAETKNAALLTFSSAWLLGLINVLNSDHLPHWGARAAIVAASLLFALAALIALYSFLPKLKLSAFHRDPEREKSLLYFADISEFDATIFAARFSERYANDAEEAISDNYLRDLAVQVAANSAITLRKFRLFNVGATIVMIALAVLAGTVSWVTYYGLWTN